MLKPVKDKIVFKVKEEEKVTDAGIILPDKMKEQEPDIAEVVAIGPGRINRKGKRIPPCVNPGDKVLIPKYAGHLIEDEGEEYLIGSEKDVLAILKN